MAKHRGTSRLLVGGLAMVALLLATRWRNLAHETQAGTTTSTTTDVLELVPEVVSTSPHDPAAFTQGLLWHDGKLYESTGQYGLSTIRRVELTSGEVEAQSKLSPELFGEGLARIDDRLVQLTWREGVGLVWALDDFALLDRFSYEGEAWGLCYDGRQLVLSDGSAYLSFRDVDSFRERSRVEVRLQGKPVSFLNELECVDGWVYANVFQTEMILRIEPHSGMVKAVVDAGGLLSEAERQAAGVLNGIAYDPSRQLFLLTGKNWPKLFAVRFKKVER